MKKLLFPLILGIATCAAAIQAQTVVFSDAFENGASNWTFFGYSDECADPLVEDGGLWHVSAKVPPTFAVNGVANPSVQYGSNHSLHFGYESHYGLTTYNPAFDPNNIDPAISPTLGSASIGLATSQPIDLTDMASAQLTFTTAERFDNGYYAWQSNGRWISVLVNGQAVAWVFERYSGSDGNWENVTVDLSAFCGQVIQLQMGIEVFPPVWDPSVDGELYFPEADRDRGDGWYIDNLQITGVSE